MQSAEPVHASQILGSWKEIASYMGKSVRTVQRWETMGLPVKRPLVRAKGVVQASRVDLDRWMASEWALRAGFSKAKANEHTSNGSHENGATHCEVARDIRDSNRRLISEIEIIIAKLHQECRSLENSLRRPRN